MSKLTKGIICVVVIMIGVCIYNLTQVEAREFNEEAAIETYKNSLHVSDKFTTGMSNNVAISNTKAMIDYLNGSNIFNLYENLIKMALTNSMRGNTINAIIFYNWIELTFNDVRFVISDSDLQKEIDVTLMKISFLKMQIYNNLDQVNTANLLDIESQMIDYYNNTPTRCAVYNQKIINKVYSSLD